MGLFETLFRVCNQGGFDQHHYLQSNSENTTLNFESGRWREGCGVFPLARQINEKSCLEKFSNPMRNQNKLRGCRENFESILPEIRRSRFSIARIFSVTILRRRKIGPGAAPP